MELLLLSDEEIILQAYGNQEYNVPWGKLVVCNFSI